MLIMFVIWAVLATILLGLAVFRKFATRNEDDYIHVSDSRISARQTELAQTLDVLDRWEKLLGIVVLVTGIALLGAYLYISWQAGGQAQ